MKELGRLLLYDWDVSSAQVYTCILSDSPVILSLYALRTYDDRR